MTLSNAQERAIKKLYYKEGNVFGRDKIYYELKLRLPVHYPTKHEINGWLKKQRIHQILTIPDKPKTVTAFRTIAPLHSFSIDLIDFSNKGVNGYHYVINMIDNFSRFMWTAKIKKKEAKHVVAAVEPIFKMIKKKYGKLPKYILSDRGGEFMKEYNTLLESFNIRTHRTIGGTPSSNGLVERSNGTLKGIMGKLKKIKINERKDIYPNWYSMLEEATATYNNGFHSSIKMKPKDAIELTDEDTLKEMRDSHKKERVKHGLQPKPYKEGDEVRLRILKNALSKYSEPNFSANIYEIEKVKPSRATTATKYTLKGMPEKKWVRENLLLIEGDEPPPPEYEIKTRAEKKIDDAPKRSSRNKK